MAGATLGPVPLLTGTIFSSGLKGGLFSLTLAVVVVTGDRLGVWPGVMGGWGRSVAF